MTSLTVRPATGSDLPGLRALLDRCSAETTYRRFHGAVGGAVNRELERIADPRPDHHSWIAIDGTEIHGTATLARGSNGVVEAAFLVEDGWFRHGIGRALFAALARDAEASGAEAVTAWVQADNERARRFLRSMVPGTRMTFIGGGELEISLPVGVPTRLSYRPHSSPSGDGLMKTDEPTLTQLHAIAPFDQCSVRVLRAMAPHVDRIRVRSGTVLAREGTEPREFIAVLSGEIAASRHGADVGVDGAGARIGGSALVDRRPHDATWTAMTDLDVLVVNGPAYRWVNQVVERTAAA